MKKNGYLIKKDIMLLESLTYKGARTNDNWDKIWKNKITEIAKKNEK